jgi:hypothetical protein
LIGRLFPYTSHVLFTDLRHSNLNDVRKETFSSKRSALVLMIYLLGHLWVFYHTIVYYGGHSHALGVKMCYAIVS